MPRLTEQQLSDVLRRIMDLSGGLSVVLPMNLWTHNRAAILHLNIRKKIELIPSPKTRSGYQVKSL